MVALWQELDLNSDKERSCSQDATCFKVRLENERVFKFLASLNKDLDDVCSRILVKSRLPFTCEVFSEVRCEDSCHKVMMKEEPMLAPEPAACSNEPTSKGSKGKVTCDHCKKSGHTKGTCWDIYGKPPDWKPKKHRSYGYQTLSGHRGESFKESLQALLDAKDD